MIPLDQRRLQPGSPTARAVFELMSGARLVRLDCDDDERLDAALTVAANLLRHAGRRVDVVVNSKLQAADLARNTLPYLPVLGGELPLVVAGGGVVLGRGHVGDVRFNLVPADTRAIIFVSGLPKTLRFARTFLPSTSLLVAGLNDRPWKGLGGSMSWTQADRARLSGLPQKVCPFARQVLIVGHQRDWHGQLDKLVAHPERVWGTDGPWGPVPPSVVLAGAPL